MTVSKTIKIQTIETLQDFLSPIGKFKQFYEKENDYLFRGEGSAQNPLTPSLFRGNTIELLYHGLRKELPSEAQVQYEKVHQEIELKSLIQFYKLANNNGIPLPDSKILKSSQIWLDDNYIPTGDEWLPKDLLDLFSLARHYEFPTRLIDWTDNIYTALYFACSNALKTLNSDGNMIVYILNQTKLQKTSFPIKFVRPLRFYNENAKAQYGVLSYIVVENQLSLVPETLNLSDLEKETALKVDKRPLDEQLRTYFNEYPFPDQEMLYKVVISKTITKELYTYLDALHYSAEQIFPGLYGVVRKMVKDEVNWSLFNSHNIK